MKSKAARKISLLFLGLVLNASACQNLLAAAEENRSPDSVSEEASSSSSAPAQVSNPAPTPVPTPAPAPVQFTVVFDQVVNANSATSKNGFVGHLRTDLSVDGRLLAASGSLVKGHIEAISTNGQLIKTPASRPQLSATLPFRVIFDEIVSPDHRSLKMHAVPTNQCSMVTVNGRLRSIEVTTSGIVRSPDRDSLVQLGKGDELVVKIKRERSFLKSNNDAAPVALSAGRMNHVPAPAKARSSADDGPDLIVKTVVKPGPSVSSENEIETASPEDMKAKPSSTQAEQTAHTANNKAASDNKPAATTDESSTANTDAKNQVADADAPTASAKNDGEEIADDQSKKMEEAAKKAQSVLSELGVTIDGTMSKNFKIAFVTPLSTQQSNVDDQVIGVLREDMRIGDKVIAKEGSALVGHIASIRESCKLGQAMKSKRQKDAALKIQFDRLVTVDQKELPIVGSTPLQETVFKNGGVFKTITVSSGGEISRNIPMNLSGNSEAKNLAGLVGLALMGPQAAMAMPILLVTALAKAEPGISRVIQKKVMDKGDELIIYPGDQISVQARLLDPAKEQLYVAGRVVHGKNLKTIKTAASHPAVE